MDDRYAERLQMIRRADPGKLQQMRRVDGAAAQQHLPPGPQGAFLPALAEGDADAFRALEHKLRG